MIQNIFYQAPCLANDLPSIGFDELRAKWFARSDKRYPVQVLQKLIDFNKEEFAFLGVKVSIIGSDRSAALQVSTDRFVGAIALRSPDNGKYLGDLAIYPRFTKGKDVFAPITELFPVLGVSCRPEFIEKPILSSGAIVKPPLYYDAVLFVDLIDKVLRSKWRKFRTEERIHAYPTSATRWERHAASSSQMERILRYPSCDNTLSLEHAEWSELLYVYDKAVEEIDSIHTPAYLRYQLESKLHAISKVVVNMKRKSTIRVMLHAADPTIVKETKVLANIILQQNFRDPRAWRIDLAEFFERYCQHNVEAVSNEIAAQVRKNQHFSCTRRELPSWGLSYLEPDILVQKDNALIVIDAKYKSHMFNLASSTEDLKKAHRQDLHQLLAYCSFDQAINKTGILIYPCSDRVVARVLEYRNASNGVKNRVVLLGVPIGLQYMKEIRDALRPHLLGT